MAYKLGEPLRELPPYNKKYEDGGKWPELLEIAREFSPKWVPILNVSKADAKSIVRAFRRPYRKAVGYDASVRDGVPHIRYVPNVKGIVERAKKQRK